MFEPYNVYQFECEVKNEVKTKVISANIMIVEIDVPNLEVNL